MRTKRVNRYYCDFCGKGSGGAAAMRKHERHCTMNPDRDCRMCRFMDQPQTQLADLIAVLPDPPDYRHEDEYSVWYQDFDAPLQEAIAKARAMAGNCPACLLAAIRQRGWGGMANFDYATEVQAVFDEARKREERAEMDSLMYG